MDENFLLITPADIRNYEDIAAMVKDERINNCIRKMQDLDLKPFLGTAFYWDFIRDIQDVRNSSTVPGFIPTPKQQLAKDLLYGKEYQNKSGHSILFEGMTKALVYYSFSRFVHWDNIRQTQSGAVTKKLDHSDPLSDSNIAKRVAQIRSEANAYMNDIENFLQDNKENYPLWRFNERNKQSRQPGARIRAIDKTSYNQTEGYYGYFNNPYNLIP